MTTNSCREILHITDAARIADLSGLLHDETFELDTIKYSPESQKLAIPCRRHSHDASQGLVDTYPPLLEAFPPDKWKTFETDWMQSLVTISFVHTWAALHDQGINQYSFLHWRIEPGLIQIEANEALVLRCDVEEIDIVVADIGFKGKSRLLRGSGGVEISSGDVYV